MIASLREPCKRDDQILDQKQEMQRVEFHSINGINLI